MHTFIINATLLTGCHADMFQPSKGHLQGVQLTHFSNKMNKMSYQIKIQRSELRVTCYAAATSPLNLTAANSFR